jgi:iron complex outermembrane recepter protein
VKHMYQGVLTLGLALSIPATALAQRTNENAVTQAGDAFGKSVGSERIGLYSAEDVRGFNPVDAGNARIDGLYFDQQDRVPNRLIDGNTIRVGITAQRYPFPAPTGIVDYPLTTAGPKTEASVEIERGPYGGLAGSIELKIPVGATLGLSGGVGARRQIRPEGGVNNFRNFGITLAWRPYADALIAPFFGGYTNKGDEARATIFPIGNDLPRIPRARFLGQNWTDRNYVSRSYGVIAKLPLGGVRVEAGLFRSSRDTSTSYSDILTGVNSSGVAQRRTIIADGNNLDTSLSGEARVVRLWTDGDMRHTLFASVRGRAKNRLFGGTQRILLGASSAIAPDFRSAPVISLDAEDDDRVRQLTYGVGYSVNWARRGSLDVSMSKSRYRKTVDFANPLLPNIVTRDDPLLWSATGSILLSKRLALYGGYVRGLEEAAVAPDVATNRSEAPPAVRTRQIDLGFRYAVTPKLSLVAGLFSVKKPYFNLDPASRFRALGTVDNRGVEISLAGQLAKGVTVVAGAVLLNPTISGEAVDARLIGVRPVGSVKRRAIANFDWRLGGGTGPWSFDLGLESLSSRVGNASPDPALRLSAPARETINIGTRYRFPIGPYTALMRFQITNLLDDYGWLVSSSGGFTTANGRTFIAQLVADF